MYKRGVREKERATENKRSDLVLVLKDIKKLFHPVVCLPLLYFVKTFDFC